MKTFATTNAIELLDARDHASRLRRESYFNPWQTETVYCTCEEREDFEQDTGIDVDADVIETESDYAAFVNFLTENYDLTQI